MKIISWIFWVTQLFLRLREFEALLLFDCAKLPEQLPEFLLIALPAGPAGTRLWSQPSQIRNDRSAARASLHPPADTGPSAWVYVIR